MATEKFRSRTNGKLLDRGASPNAAMMGAVAIHFLEDGFRPMSRQYEKAARRISRATAKAARKTPTHELDDLFVQALKIHKEVAREFGESHYSMQAGVTMSQYR